MKAKVVGAFYVYMLNFTMQHILLSVTKKSIFIFACSLSCFASLHAQVYYQDITPDKTMATWDSRDIRIDSPATSVLAYGAPGNITIWNEFGTVININAFSNCEVLMNGAFPAALNSGDVVSSSGTWQQPSYATLNDGSSGNWMGVTDKYLGVRIKRNNQWCYGWIRLDVNAAGTSVTIKDYACNLTAGASVNAGEHSTGIGSAGPANAELTVYPQPANDRLYLLTNDEKAIIRITDINGRTFPFSATRSNSDKMIILDISGLSQGTYFVSIVSMGVATTKQVEVIR